MPRALLSDARSFAASDAPLLPFLAPRLLTERPRRNTATPCNVQPCGPARKTEDLSPNARPPACTQNAASSRGDSRVYQHNTSCARGGISPSPLTRSGFSHTIPGLPLHISNNLSWRYSAVYSYAHQQLAYQSTTSAGGRSKARKAPKRSTSSTNVGVRLKSARNPGRAGRSKIIGHIRGSCHKQTTKGDDGPTLEDMTHGRRGGRVTPIRLVAPSSMKWHAAKILTWRRGRRLLNLERRRLRLFISYLTRRGLQARTQKLNTEQLKSFGQYRSLKRRHYALNLRHDVQLRLTEATALWPTVAIEALSALDFRVYHGLPRNRYRTRLFHDAQTLRLVKDLCQNADASGADAMLTNWMAIPEGVRNKSWHLILLFLLHNRPVRALQFLQVLSQPPYVATLMPEVLADALEHLAGRCALNPTGQLSQASAILPVFTLVFERHLAKYQAICSEDLLRSLVRLATYDDLVHLFNLITRANSTVGCYTLLKFANTFSGFGDHDNALRCLHRILESIPPAVAKRVVSRKSFKWSCALVLRKSSMGGHNHSQTTELVAAFLRMGLKLDILMYNVIMHNAMEAGDIPTALRVYRLLEDNKVQPDRYTYSILLHGCAMAEDPALFADFAEHCAEKALELQSPWVASGYLHYLYRRYAKVDLDELAVVAHRAYTRFFLTEPLQDLVGPGVMDYGGPIEDDSARMKPQTVALYIMLQIEIRKALLHGAEEVWKLYSRFRRSVEEACHSPVVDLAKLPVTWNAFLLAFCRRQQFATASEMIKTMTDGQAQGFPQPNIFTWNIFMDGFVKAQQSRAAVRIFEILQSRGVKPDQCTYSTLLKTYVKTQQVGQIADVVGSMDREQQLDGHVLAILTKVRDRKSLMQALEKSKLAKEREETSEQEEQAQKMRRRWNLPGLVHRPPLVQAAEQVETSDIVEVRER